MKDVYVFLPEPGNTRAMIAVSAVARAMKEMNKVAIVRCVWRQGQANVVIGVLTPNLSDKENIVGFFCLCFLYFILVYLYWLQFCLFIFYLFLSFLCSLIHFT